MRYNWIQNVHFLHPNYSRTIEQKTLTKRKNYLFCVILIFFTREKWRWRSMIYKNAQYETPRQKQTTKFYSITPGGDFKSKLVFLPHFPGFESP